MDEKQMKKTKNKKTASQKTNRLLLNLYQHNSNYSRERQLIILYSETFKLQSKIIYIKYFYCTVFLCK